VRPQLKVVAAAGGQVDDLFNATVGWRWSSIERPQSGVVDHRKLPRDDH
jgi:hypothetical protein